MVTAQLYRPEMKAAWDRFVAGSKTPLFFFLRDFMEYHADRFEDSSLVFLDEGQVVGLLPASRHTTAVVSHGGLTFGGLLVDRTARSGSSGQMLEAGIAFLKEQGVVSLRYKAIPHIFHRQPGDEDLYFLTNRFQARLDRRDISSVIMLSDRLKLSKGRRALLSKARQANMVIERSFDWGEFHALLESVLLKHDAHAVHSPAELAYLSGQFPENVQLHVARKDGTLLAATLLFMFEGVVHTQYLAVSEAGKAVGALDFLIEQTIVEAAAKEKFFSFGISTEQNGKVLNEGLLGQKEGFGARAIVIDTYEVPIG